MSSDIYIAIFTYLMISLAIFSGLSLLETVSPPNTPDMEEVKINVGSNVYPVYSDRVPVENGDKIEFDVRNRDAKGWVKYESLRSDPNIEIIDNKFDTTDTECGKNSYKKYYYDEDKIYVEKYKIEYAGNTEWIEFYCSKY